jgi:hypothetical protein
MGIISALLGTKPNINDIPDGLWLKHERDGEWSQVAVFGSNQAIEVAQDSCYKRDGGVFCVLRAVDREDDAIHYLGCCIPDGVQEVVIAVDRAEDHAGNVIKGDDWEKNRVLTTTSIPSLQAGIALIRRTAAFNGYQNQPPYVAILSIGITR